MITTQPIAARRITPSRTPINDTVSMSTRRSGRASKPESSAAGGRQEWSVEEDDEVNRAVARLGKKAWAQVAEELNASGVTGSGCARTGKQVRARWVSSLDPDIRSGPWTAAEERECFEP